MTTMEKRDKAKEQPSSHVHRNVSQTRTGNGEEAGKEISAGTAKDPLSALDERIVFHEDKEDDFDFRIPEDDDFDIR